MSASALPAPGEHAQPVTRFAPSPTGELHLGNARTALFNFLLARHGGGRFLLRIEDTDTERSRESHSAALMADLRWLGLEWDAGPDHEDERGPYRQSQRGALYARYFAELERQGAVYPCFCTPLELSLSRRAQLAAGRPPRYAGTCRDLPPAERARREGQGLPATLRFRVPPGERVAFDDLVHGPQSFLSDDIGDFIVRRADGTAAFFFSNAVDDACMGVTHAARGGSPHQHPAAAADPCGPGAAGARLRTRRPAGRCRRRAALQAPRGGERARIPRARLPPGGARQSPVPPGPLDAAPRTSQPRRDGARRSISRTCGAPRRASMSSSSRCGRSEAVHQLSPAAARTWLAPILPAGLEARAADAFIAAVLPNVVLPEDARPWVEIVFGDPPPLEPAGEELVRQAGTDYFSAAAAAAARAGNDLAAIAAAVRAATGRKGAQLFMPLRVALTGRAHGPELAPLLKAMPPGKARERLARFA